MRRKKDEQIGLMRVVNRPSQDFGGDRTVWTLCYLGDDIVAQQKCRQQIDKKIRQE